MSRSNRSSVCLAVLTTGLLVSAAAFAQVTMQDAQVRGTMPGQTSNGAFMTLQSADGAKVVSVTMPVAGTTEIHEMEMEGGVMRMRAVPSLELPEGQTVQLKPGGYHVMLMDLKQPLAKDVTVLFTLKVEPTDRHVVKQKVEACVRDLIVGNMPTMDHGGEHKHWWFAASVTSSHMRKHSDG